jgi:hypothetical protein
MVRPLRLALFLTAEALLTESLQWLEYTGLSPSLLSRFIQL